MVRRAQQERHTAQESKGHLCRSDSGDKVRRTARRPHVESGIHAVPHLRHGSTLSSAPSLSSQHGEYCGAAARVWLARLLPPFAPAAALSVYARRSASAAASHPLLPACCRRPPPPPTSRAWPACPATQDGHGLPVDLLRLVLQAVLGEERQDAYRLVRDLQRFALVCKTWREAVFSTPLRLNLDYQPEVKWEAVRWLLRATFADLQIHPSERGGPGRGGRGGRQAPRQGPRQGAQRPGISAGGGGRAASSAAWSRLLHGPGHGWVWPWQAPHPSPTCLPAPSLPPHDHHAPPPPPPPPPDFHINRLLTNPDFAARNKWSLQRLWGAQLAGAPGRWPQWRHFPALHTLELSCDSQAMAMGQPQFFESRLLAPLPKLKHLRWGRGGQAGARVCVCTVAGGGRVRVCGTGGLPLPTCLHAAAPAQRARCQPHAWHPHRRHASAPCPLLPVPALPRPPLAA